MARSLDHEHAHHSAVLLSAMSFSVMNLASLGIGVCGGDRAAPAPRWTGVRLPARPPGFVQLVDRMLAGRSERGLFQYIVLEKGGAGDATGL